MAKVKMLLVAALLIGVSNFLISEEKEEKAVLTAEMKFCTGVEDREPVGEATSFSADVGRVYCWTRIKGAKEETTIKHVWYFKGRKMCEVELSVRSVKFRTWSYKTVMEHQTGEWTVKILDEDGNLINEGTITIKEEKEEE